MLEKLTNQCNDITKNSTNIIIDYEKINYLIGQLKEYQYENYLVKLLNYEKDKLVNFILIYDSINFSFFGEPKWSIKVDNKILDGSFALLNIIKIMFEQEDPITYLNNISYHDFKNIFNQTNEIPLLDERYIIIKDVTNIVLTKMNNKLYDEIIQ